MPGAGDTATIGSARAVNVSSNVTVAGLNLAAKSKLDGSGNVTVTGTFAVHDATLTGTGGITMPAGSVLNFDSSISTTTTSGGKTGGKTKSLSSRDLLGGLIGGVLGLVGGVIGAVDGVLGVLINIAVDKPIDNFGTVNVNSGNLSFATTFNNHAGAVFNLNNDVALTVPGSSIPTFNNEGTFNKSAGIGGGTVALNFRNSGSINAQSGTLNFYFGCTQSAGRTNLGGGAILAGTATNPGLIDIQGGALQGTGTITGNVRNDALASPGHSPGAITIMGNYTQTSNGTLNMEIEGLSPGTQYDQLNVRGTASLSGTLNIVLLNGFVPADKSSFQLINYYSESGKFTATNGLYPGSQRYFTTTFTPTYYVAASHADTTAPAIAVSKPTGNSSYSGLTAASGTASDGGSGLSTVTMVLYRYAASTRSAGYWSGGTNWSSTYSAAANERPVSGTSSWSLSLPSLGTGQYYVRSTAKDKTGNTTTSANYVFAIGTSVTATRSLLGPVVAVLDGGLSTATALATNDGVRLDFNRPLDTATALDATHFSVEVNGRVTAVERVFYHPATWVMVLSLPRGTLEAGDQVTVTWHDLHDAQGVPLTGAIGPLVARGR